MDGWLGVQYDCHFGTRVCMVWQPSICIYRTFNLGVFFLLSVLDPLVTVRVPLSACASYLTLYHGLYRLRAHNSLEPKAILRRATQKKKSPCVARWFMPFCLFSRLPPPSVAALLDGKINARHKTWSTNKRRCQLLLTLAKQIML